MIPLLPFALALLPFPPSSTQQAEGRANDLEQLDLDALIDRLPRIEEQWVPKPGGEVGWQPHPVAGELERRLDERVPIDSDQLRRVLMRTGALRLRERWPAEHPFALSLREPAWLNLAEIRLLPRDPGLLPAVVGTVFKPHCSLSGPARARECLYQELGLLQAGRRDLVFDVTIERKKLLARGARRDDLILWRGEMSFMVDVVESLEEALPPVTSPEIDQAVRASLGLAFDVCECPVVLVLNPGRADGEPLAAVGISLTVDLLREGETKVVTTLVPYSDSTLYARSTHDSVHSSLAFGVPLHVPAGIQNDPAELGAWSIRVRGTPVGILSQWDARTQWCGEIEITLAELSRRKAPAVRGPWFDHRD